MVKHLSQDISSKVSNNHEELVALWLCLYFSQKIWTVEEIYEHLDFGQIQERLATLIGQNLLSNAEICCIFFGMKKISGKYIILCSSDQITNVESTNSEIFTKMSCLFIIT